MSAQVSAANGTKFYIATSTSGQTVSPQAFDVPPADATTAAALTYTQVRKVETIGDFGDTAQSVTFTALDDERTEKSKGARDAGDLTLTVAYIAPDPGQRAMDAAEAQDANFVFKIVANDEPIGGAAGTTTYLYGLVTQNKRQTGAANNVTRIMFSIALNAAPIEVPAH